MADLGNFAEAEAQLNRDIESEAERIRSLGEPPPTTGLLVDLYKRRIAGEYDVDRAKKDTDAAVDLLYIAYNATPQEQGEIRADISRLMQRLINVQRDSEKQMSAARTTARLLKERMDTVFATWTIKKKANDEAAHRAFIKKNFLSLVKKIETDASKVATSLLGISKAYDAIIEDASAATEKSELALSKEHKNRAKFIAEINEAKAKQAQLDALVKDLREEVTKFENKARIYEQRAQSAEDKAFIMSIVRVGAQMVTSAIPAVVMASGGAVPATAASVLGSMAGSLSPKTGSDAVAGDKTAEIVKAKTKISEQELEIKKADEKTVELKKDIEDLKAKKGEVVAKQGKAELSGTDKVMVDTLEKEVSRKTEEIKAQEEARAKADKIIASAKGTMEALDKGMKEMTAQQKEQADDLRSIQMQMLSKAEEYEKERRLQNAELVKINVLLQGKVGEKEIVEIAIRALNISVKALMAAQAVIVEIASFFLRFSGFMEGVALEAASQLDRCEDPDLDEEMSGEILDLTVRNVDTFLIKQGAEWVAVIDLCDRFIKCFHDGWSDLNDKKGTYLTEEHLKLYMVTAAARLKAIVDERDTGHGQRLSHIRSLKASEEKKAA